MVISLWPCDTHVHYKYVDFLHIVCYSVQDIQRQNEFFHAHMDEISRPCQTTEIDIQVVYVVRIYVLRGSSIRILYLYKMYIFQLHLFDIWNYKKRLHIVHTMRSFNFQFMSRNLHSKNVFLNFSKIYVSSDML